MRHVGVLVNAAIPGRLQQGHSTFLGKCPSMLECACFYSSLRERTQPLSYRTVRKYPRVRANFSVEFIVSSRTFRGRVLTLGGGGLFLAVQQGLAPGTEIKVRFRPAKHLPVVRAKGRVCYELPGQGMALEFTNISSEHRKLLLRLIHRRTADRRWHTRAPLATQIRCKECMSLAFSRDVSVGGMFVETNRPLAPGSQANLRFNLDDSGPIVIALAEVTYEVPRLGMGVQFVDIAASDRKRLEEYVSKYEVLQQPAPPVKSSG